MEKTLQGSPAIPPGMGRANYAKEANMKIIETAWEAYLRETKDLVTRSEGESNRLNMVDRAVERAIAQVAL